MARVSQVVLGILLASIAAVPCAAEDGQCFQASRPFSDEKIVVTTNGERSRLEYPAAQRGIVQSAQLEYTVARHPAAKTLLIHLNYIGRGPEGPRQVTLAVAAAKAPPFTAENARQTTLATQQPLADLTATEAITPARPDSLTTIDVSSLVAQLIPALEAGKDALIVVFNGDQRIFEFFLNGLIYERKLRDMKEQMDVVFANAAAGKC